jgi:hypothetical protein
MSYWFAKPHTLVLARAHIDLRYPRNRDRLLAKSEAAFEDRALALSWRGWKCCSGVSFVCEQADQYFAACEMPCSRTLIRRFRRRAYPGPFREIWLKLVCRGLGQDTDCSGLQDLRTDDLAGRGRNENEWHTVPAVEQDGLQFHTAHARHLDVRNHA